jgi:AcrR family transcriptional regulator
MPTTRPSRLPRLTEAGQAGRRRPSAVAPSPWANRADREQEREAKREAVLRAAAQVFNEQGFQASTLDQVAARLNVTKPTLYYYVKSKDEILFECVRIGLSMLQQAADEVTASGGNAADKLVAVMRQYAEIATMDFGMCVIRVGEDPLPAEAKVELRRMKARLDRVFRELVRQGIQEGSIGPCDPKLAAFTIAGALSWIARWYRPDGGQTAAQIADEVIGLLLKGLSIRTSQTEPVTA